MKITSLLIQYLYTNHRLDLPRIGTFILDPAVKTLLDNPKERLPITEGISFESKPGLKESPDLVAYISAETGKMKSLAASDLESRIELALQFLNIGKPFTFEGLGTLIKRTSGEVEFSAAFILPERRTPVKETGNRAAKENANRPYESFLTEPRKSGGIGKPVIAMLIIGGIILAIGAGYLISRPAGETPAPQAVASAAVDTPETTVPVTVADSNPVPSTDTQVPVTGSVAATTPETTRVATPPRPVETNAYKYVLEIAKSDRAFKRYNQLRTNLWKVQLETRDSVQYKLFLMIPASNADTTRIMDSLTVMTGKQVYIEYATK